MSESLPYIELPSGYVETVGRIALEWNNTELLLITTLGLIVGNYHKADVIMHTVVSFNARMSILENLTRECLFAKDLRDPLLEALESLKREVAHRNDLVHGIYGVRISDGMPILHQRKPNRIKSPNFHKKMPLSELEIVLKRITEKTARLHELNMELWMRRDPKVRAALQIWP